jgi:hypothetical protein
MNIDIIFSNLFRKKNYLSRSFNNNIIDTKKEVVIENKNNSVIFNKENKDTKENKDKDGGGEKNDGKISFYIY